MKQLMLKILAEAKDFDDFKARFVPALEEAIKQDADWAEMAEKIRADLLGFNDASNLSVGPDRNDDDFLTSCQIIAADIESGNIEKELCRLMFRPRIRSEHSWFWLLEGFKGASEEERSQGLEIILAAVRSTHPEIKESL